MNWKNNLMGNDSNKHHRRESCKWRWAPWRPLLKSTSKLNLCCTVWVSEGWPSRRGGRPNCCTCSVAYLHTGEQTCSVLVASFSFCFFFFLAACPVCFPPRGSSACQRSLLSQDADACIAPLSRHRGNNLPGVDNWVITFNTAQERVPVISGGRGETNREDRGVYNHNIQRWTRLHHRHGGTSSLPLKWNELLVLCNISGSLHLVESKKIMLRHEITNFYCHQYCVYQHQLDLITLAQVWSQHETLQ